MHVCIYFCMYRYIQNIYIYIERERHTRMHACVSLLMNTYDMHIYTYTHTQHTPPVCMYMYVRTNECMHAWMDACVRLDLYVYVCMCSFVHVPVYTVCSLRAEGLRGSGLGAGAVGFT